MCPRTDTRDPFWLMRVGPFKPMSDHMRNVKTIRVQLPVVASGDVDEMLDRVTALDGVVAALLDVAGAALEVVLARQASALHVREQLRALTATA